MGAARAAANLAVGHGPEAAASFLTAYATTTATRPERHWLVMDAVGFLPAPGGPPLFSSAAELERLDAWLQQVVSDDPPF